VLPKSIVLLLILLLGYWCNQRLPSVTCCSSDRAWAGNKYFSHWPWPGFDPWTGGWPALPFMFVTKAPRSPSPGAFRYWAAVFLLVTK